LVGYLLDTKYRLFTAKKGGDHMGVVVR